MVASTSIGVIIDLGIRGRSALVCASSRGLGLAAAHALAAEGVDLVMNGLDPDRLAASAGAVREKHGVDVIEIPADITTAEGRARIIESAHDPDILITNNGGPHPRTFDDLAEEDWSAALNANMVSPLMLISSVLPGMRMRRFGRIVNITSAMVTSPRPSMTLSSGARAGLTAAVKGISLEVIADNVTINNVLPERFDTDRQRFMAEQTMKRDGVEYAEARRRQESSIAAGRLGRPEEFGALCAFLCGDLAGYLSGNNIHADGGSYTG